MTTHTPGPWGIYGDTALRRVSMGESVPGITIGSVHHTEPICRVSGYLQPLEANARLIAAAPEQHKALRNAPPLPQGFMQDMTREEQLEWLCTYADWWRDERGPALRKVEGR